MGLTMFIKMPLSLNYDFTLPFAKNFLSGVGLNCLNGVEWNFKTVFFCGFEGRKDKRQSQTQLSDNNRSWFYCNLNF